MLCVADLNGVGERMPQMEGPRHVGGRDDNHKGGLVAVRVRFEAAGLLPPVVPGCFDCRGAVALGHVPSDSLPLPLGGGLGLLDLLLHLSSVFGLYVPMAHVYITNKGGREGGGGHRHEQCCSCQVGLEELLQPLRLSLFRAYHHIQCVGCSRTRKEVEWSEFSRSPLGQQPQDVMLAYA